MTTTKWRKSLFQPQHQLLLHLRYPKQIRFRWLQELQGHQATNLDLILYHIRLMSCHPPTRRPLRLTCHQNCCTWVGESSGQGAKTGLTFSTECRGTPCGRCPQYIPITVPRRRKPRGITLGVPHTSIIQSMTPWVSTTDLTSPKR